MGATVAVDHVGLASQGDTLAEAFAAHREGDMIGPAIIDAVLHGAASSIGRDGGDEFAHVGAGGRLALGHIRFRPLGPHLDVRHADLQLAVTALRLKAQFVASGNVQYNAFRQAVIEDFLLKNHLAISLDRQPAVAARVGIDRSGYEGNLLVAALQVEVTLAYVRAHQGDIRIQRQAGGVGGSVDLDLFPLIIACRADGIRLPTEIRAQILDQLAHLRLRRRQISRLAGLLPCRPERCLGNGHIVFSLNQFEP